MSTAPRPDAKAAPIVEGLLAAAHQALLDLRVACELISTCGVAREHLPAEATLKAFALLGDHGRTGLLDDLQNEWQGLLARGLARGTLVATSTPLLRLLAHALPYTSGIDDLRARLEAAHDAPFAPVGWLHCVNVAEGAWGQLAQLEIWIPAGCANLLVLPAPIFGSASALLSADDGCIFGTLEIPIDDGDIELRALSTSGRIYRHVVVVKAVQEGWA